MMLKGRTAWFLDADPTHSCKWLSRGSEKVWNPARAPLASVQVLAILK